MNDLGRPRVIHVCKRDRSAVARTVVGVGGPARTAARIERQYVLRGGRDVDLYFTVAVDVTDGRIGSAVGSVRRHARGPYLRAIIAPDRSENAVLLKARAAVCIKDVLGNAVAVEIGDDRHRRDLEVFRQVIWTGLDMRPRHRALAIGTDFAGLAVIRCIFALTNATATPGKQRNRVEFTDRRRESAARVRKIGDASAELGLADLPRRTSRRIGPGRAPHLGRVAQRAERHARARHARLAVATARAAAHSIGRAARVAETRLGGAAAVGSASLPSAHIAALIVDAGVAGRAAGAVAQNRRAGVRRDAAHHRLAHVSERTTLIVARDPRLRAGADAFVRRYVADLTGRARRSGRAARRTCIIIAAGTRVTRAAARAQRGDDRGEGKPSPCAD